MVYLSQLTAERANKSDHLASYLGLTFMIDDEDKLSTDTVILTSILSILIPLQHYAICPSYDVYISQLIRYVYNPSHIIMTLNIATIKLIIDRLLSQGYTWTSHLRNFMADISVQFKGYFTH